MPYHPDLHHRRSIRLRDFDYVTAGAYFVTICVQGRGCRFGEVVDGVMVVNDAGRMVEKWWGELAHKYGLVAPDFFVVMPNHFHGILFLVGADLCVRPGLPADHFDVDTGSGAHIGALLPETEKSGTHAGVPLPEMQKPGAHAGAPLPEMQKPGAHAGASLPTVIQWFKTMTTNEYMRNVAHSGWKPFPGRLWQRNYFERVIRNDAELEKFRTYIVNNPAGWDKDEENPLIG